MVALPFPTESALLRDLVVASFSDEEFMMFCYDNFREVYDNFPAGAGRTYKVHILIEHCQRQGSTNKLLQLIKVANQYQYNNYVERKLIAASTPFLDDNIQHSSERQTLTFKVTGNFDNLTQEQLAWAIKAFQEALATITESSPEEFDVMETKEGSLTLKIRMPSDIASKLLAMEKSNSSLLDDLGIQSISTIDLRSEYEYLFKALKSLAIDIDDDKLSALTQTRRNEISEALGERLAASNPLIHQRLEDRKFINDLVKRTKEYLESRVEKDELSFAENIKVSSILKSIEKGEEKIHKWPWPLGIGVRKK